MRGGRPRDRLAAGVRVLPRRGLSRLVGHLARARVPRPLLAPAIALYARAYGVDLEEAVRPPGGWRSFVDFFARRLREGARPLPADPTAIVSPADGRVHAAGAIDGGTVLQAKGIDYRVADLLRDEELARRLEGGTFVTVYLSPRDYHRFHWPFDARLERIAHVPGDLWPVHPGAVAGVPGLFARNERLVLDGTVADGGAFAYVPVGALNVGSIRLERFPVRTNRGRGGPPRRWPAGARPVRRGEPCGWFELGSAIVLLLAPEAGTLDPFPPGTPVRMGTPLGHRLPTQSCQGQVRR